MAQTFLYIETDGVVYLVERDGQMTMPTSNDSLPFEIEEKVEMEVEDEQVIFCNPILNHYPAEWHHKDEIPGQNDIDPLVKMVVNRTLPRVVVEAIIVKDGNLLLVKPSRGFNKGYWTLPGGFVSYGESPADAVIREVREEAGAKSKVEKMLGVETFVGKGTYFTWHMFFFKVELLTMQFKPAADEIEEVKWFELQDGLSQLHGIKKMKISKYIDELT